jgi:hypothetical protein
MIQSIWQIDLLNASGTTRLLDYGDVLADELRFSVSQDAARYAPIGSQWGEADAGGNAFVSVGWTRRQSHASHAAARNACLRLAAGTATRATGTLRVSVQGGETWDIADACVVSSEPQPLLGNAFRTLTAYQAIGGRMTPAAAIALTAGVQWDWTLQQWQTVSNQWQAL